MSSKVARERPDGGFTGSCPAPVNPLGVRRGDAYIPSGRVLTVEVVPRATAPRHASPELPTVACVEPVLGAARSDMFVRAGAAPSTPGLRSYNGLRCRRRS